MRRDELAARLGAVQLLDVRSAEEYSGRGGYPCDPRQGHIEGALNLEWSELVEAPDPLTVLLAHGIDPALPIVCYCHSGQRSAHVVQALQARGVTTAENYEGSWHEWSRGPAG